MRVSHSFIAAVLLAAVSVPVQADPSTTSRLGWVTNGDVSAAVQVGNTLYVGGTFTRVAPASGALGSFFGVSTTTGEAASGFPLVDGIVHAIEPDGAGGYYIGGAFSRVGGEPRTNLAHVLAGGSVDPAFTPVVSDGPVISIALSSPFLFIGSTQIITVNGQSRNGFVVLDRTTGATAALPEGAFSVARAKKMLVVGDNLFVLARALQLKVWHPEVAVFHRTTGALVWRAFFSASSTNDMVVAGSRVILGGRNLGDRVISAFDATTGAYDLNWNPGGTLPMGAPDEVHALAVLGTTLYVGGSFSTFGGQSRANAAAVDISTGLMTAWAPNPNAPVSALATTAAGTILIGGSFMQVDGLPRERFAEIDADGNATAWTANAYASAVQTMRADAAGTLVIGGQTGITGGSARTNLAAFDLASDTLLPWAPATSDEVTTLAALNGAIYIGASHLSGGAGSERHRVISAVDAVSGMPLSWVPPSTSTDVRLLGAFGSHVYVTVANEPPHRTALIRLHPTTGAVDPSWRLQIDGEVRQAVESAGILYFGGIFSLVQEQVRLHLAAADLTTGTLSPWAPRVTLPINAYPVRSLGVEGRTVYAAFDDGPIGAFDAVTGLRTGNGVALPEAASAIAVADGQLIVGTDVSYADESARPGGHVAAFLSNGQAASWNPGYVGIETETAAARSTGLLVTPTDVIVMGYQGTTPVPVQGIAVLPRTASVAPVSLRGTTVDNLVTLTWDAPSTPPAGGYVIDVASEAGSTAPLSLPTGSQATSISAVAGNGTYYARVRASGAPAGPASLPTNEIALIVGCDAPPATPPLNLAAQVSGSNVTVTWAAPPFTSASRYVLEAGSSTGSTNIGTFTVNAPQTSIGGAVPPGPYFVRIRAANACGESTESSEIFFTVGSSSAIPSAPTGLVANVAGSSVGIQWTPSAGALGYVMEVGSAPGLTDIARLPLSAFNFFVNGVPNGIYHVRVRAGNAAGLSAPSSELVIVVPQ